MCKNQSLDLPLILKNGLKTKFPVLQDVDIDKLSLYLYEANSCLFFGVKGGGEGDIKALIYGAYAGQAPVGTRLPKDNMLTKMRKIIVNNDHDALWSLASSAYRAAAFSIIDHRDVDFLLEKLQNENEENEVEKRDDVVPQVLFETDEKFVKVGNRYPKRVKKAKKNQPGLF